MDETGQMDQELAKLLLVEGATFVLLNVPEGTEFGIDMKVWNTGELFKGVKMIPAGVHFVHYSAASKATGDIAPRQGFFYNFKKSEFLVKKWDIDAEMISNEIVSGNEVRSFRENLLILDRFLGPYPYKELEKWLNLSSHINERLVDKLMPLSGQIRSALDLVSCTNENRPRASTSSEASPPASVRSPSQYKATYFGTHEENLLPDLKPVAGTDIRFTPFPENNYPEDSTPAQITQHCLDSTFVLDNLINAHAEPSDLLGELEFAYACFLIGHSLEAFEHWKRLVSVFCSCELALKKRSALYDKFVTVLEAQVAEIPEEFLADIVANHNFVYVKLKQLFKTVLFSDISPELKTKYIRFRERLTQMYEWDFSHLERDADDEAPVIVEFDE